MKKQKLEIIIGALLHDIGKALFRCHDTNVPHSQSGAEWLQGIGITNKSILEQVRYHHSKEIREAGGALADNSPAFITYWADNVAAGADRRDNAASGSENYASGGDNAASGPDNAKRQGSVYVRNAALESVFNILNSNNEKNVYMSGIIDENGAINYPVPEDAQITPETYSRILDNIKDSIKGMMKTSAENSSAPAERENQADCEVRTSAGHEAQAQASGLELDEKSINSLLEILEANLAFVPSSTDSRQICDISLFDHMKITAAAASAVYDYLEEQQITDYRETLYKKGADFYDEEIFLLCSMDFSGIQNFIYTIATSKALKNLRARSFYLEIMMEHIVDQLLNELGLSRANLLYTGGGHAYLLLPDTAACRETVDGYCRRLNHWLTDNFGTDLYMAAGYTSCSANALMNKPGGSYRAIFRRVTEKLSYSKSHRYTAEDIIRLNSAQNENHERECIVCGRSSRLVSDDRCETCDALEAMSSEIIEKDFIVILTARPEKKALKLPDDCFMIMENRQQVLERIKTDKSYLRCYGKNRRFAGENLATKLWVGDYSSASEFSELAAAAQGVRRIAVLRADVDNLGQAFVAGFEEKNTSLSRTTTFSRKLSEFFKLHINHILRNPEFFIGKAPASGQNAVRGENTLCRNTVCGENAACGEYTAGSRSCKDAGTSADKNSSAGGNSSAGSNSSTGRNALIVYSGGDDVFLIGSWDDVIGFAVDLRRSLEKYTQGTLTISAGIELYPEKYPVSAMAYQTGLLEEMSKGCESKNAVTLFDGKHTYHWDRFEKKVIGEKLDLLNRYFAVNAAALGSSALYRMLEYIRQTENEKINLARYAYMLARLRPNQDGEPEKEKIYQEFAQKMYRWIKDGEERRELITAIYLYIYLNRSKEDEDGKINAD